MQSLYFTKVTNAKVKSINIINAMGFHMHITNSNLFRAYRLSITSPADSPNTDGMHISRSTNVKISRSIIKTGDDCISIGQGAINVTINQITCGPGHGIRYITSTISYLFLPYYVSKNRNILFFWR